jgi:hypothetical protein
MMSNTHALSAHPSAHGLASTVKSWWEAYWTMRAQRTTVLMLRALDDRSLHEIESVVYGKPGERTLRYVGR